VVLGRRQWCSATIRDPSPSTRLVHSPLIVSRPSGKPIPAMLRPPPLETLHGPVRPTLVHAQPLQRRRAQASPCLNQDSPHQPERPPANLLQRHGPEPNSNRAPMDWRRGGLQKRERDRLARHGPGTARIPQGCGVSSPSGRIFPSQEPAKYLSHPLRYYFHG
jgi:hypothetical protein